MARADAAERSAMVERLKNDQKSLQIMQRKSSDLARSEDLASGAAELQHRVAEINDLKLNLERLQAKYKAGFISSSEIDAAQANIEHLQADLLKRQSEIYVSAQEGAAHSAEMLRIRADVESALVSANAARPVLINLQKLKDELDIATARLDKMRSEFSSGFTPQSEVEDAKAEIARAKANLLRAEEQMALLRVDDATHAKAGSPTGTSPKPK